MTTFIGTPRNAVWIERMVGSSTGLRYGIRHADGSIRVMRHDWSDRDNPRLVEDSELHGNERVTGRFDAGTFEKL